MPLSMWSVCIFAWREMNAKAYVRVPLAFRSWQVTSFSDFFFKVALSGLRSKLFKNYWWCLDTEFSIFFQLRI